MKSQSRIRKRGNGDFHQSYRPCRISEVYGQDEIKEVIRKGLDEDSLPHSILFYGVSGTGKTTLGRIIAMGLNCEKGPTSEPCCECDSCIFTMQGNSLSFVEMNAADFRGIDHVRNLRADFSAAPFGFDRKRIYLIDECHGLMAPAQNALLKSIEDTREHLHFIFCSTDPKKIIEPLRNRCIEFQFKEIEDNIIWELLLEIMDQEGYEPNEPIMEEIIEQVKGRVRNALNELQKAIAWGKFNKKKESVVQIMTEMKKIFHQRI